MRYLNAEAFRVALETRLRQSVNANQDIARLRRTVTFDRFLARLAVADHAAWVLKGGAALEFRIPDRARTTKDVDLALTSDDDPVAVLIDDVSADPFGDFFAFAVTGRKELAAGVDRGRVQRLSIEARLGGRVFERFVADLVTPSAEVPASERILLGARLDFAEVPVVELAVINLRSHWAEKLSAYLRRYDDRPNTRVRDLVDLVLLIEHGLEPDNALVVAVRETFASRRQPMPTGSLPSMADDWAVAFESMAIELDLQASTSVEAHTMVEEFWNVALGRMTGPAH